MEWPDDITLNFISEVQNLPVLWNPNDNNYKIPQKKDYGWQALAEKFTTSIAEVKKKWRSLQVNAVSS